MTVPELPQELEDQYATVGTNDLPKTLLRLNLLKNLSQLYQLLSSQCQTNH